MVEKFDLVSMLLGATAVVTIALILGCRRRAQSRSLARKARQSHLDDLRNQ